MVLNIQVERANASAARETAATTTAAVVAAVATVVTPPSIKTVGINLNPNYVWAPETNTNRITGYIFSQTLEVTVNDLSSERLSSVVDKAVAAGGDALQVQSVSTTLGAASMLDSVNQARALAVNNALSTAAVLASAANVTLGGIASITDSNSAPPPPVMSAIAPESDMAGGAAKATPTPVSIGDHEVQALVSVEFVFCNNPST